MTSMEYIVVGYDHSPAAQGALAWAAHYVGRNGGELLLVYVVSSAWEWELAAVQVNPDPIRREIRDLLHESWTEPLRTAGLRYQTEVTVGRPAEVLLASARRHDASLIVLGMTGRGTLGELVRGSTGREVAHHAVRPIVTVPPDWTPRRSEKSVDR
jgi:nucleotide-binding universal stress UspA family protein